MNAAPKREVFWENILVLVFTHVLGILGILYAVFLHFSWETTVLAAGMFLLTMLATTGGYHRLFAHRSYRGGRLLRLFYLVFGAAAAEQSALRWSSDHRRHHAYTDEEEDPYNIKKGFWWAHMGWLFYRSPPSDYANAKDLLADPLIRLQDRFYLPLMLGFGFLLPTLLGWTWGDAAGGLLLGGFLRLAVQYEATFCINSVAHYVGSQPYSTKTSARDSLVAALLTMGEGYHNFHHRFPSDYRNGVRAWHFDPTKWCVWILERLGLASDLKRVPEEAVEKARQEAAREREALRGSPPAPSAVPAEGVAPAAPVSPPSSA